MTDIFNRVRTAALGAAFALALTAAQAGTISTLPSTSNIGSFGNVASGSTPTYGQTFQATAGLGLYLRDFTFFYQNNSAGTLAYQAQVYRWTGTAITGPALFSSNATIAPTGSAYVDIVTAVNDLELQDQASYIALFTTLNTSGSVGGLRALTSSESAYSSGTFAYNNNPTMAGLANGWSQNVFGDLAFTMNFGAAPAAVPEPASLALAGLALFGLAAARRRRN